MQRLETALISLKVRDMVLGCIKRSVASRSREVVLPLHSCETPPGVLCPALEPSAQDRHGPVGMGPGRATKVIRELEHLC